MTNQLSIEFLHDSIREYFAGEWLHQPSEPDWLNRLDERLELYQTWAEAMYLMSGLLNEGEMPEFARWCSDWRDNPYGLDHLAEHLHQLAVAYPDAAERAECRQKLYQLISDEAYLDRKSDVVKAISSVLSEIQSALNLALEDDDIVKITRFGRYYVQRKERSKRAIEKIPEWIAEGDYEPALDIARLFQQDGVKFVSLLWIARLILDQGDSDPARVGRRTAARVGRRTAAKQILSEALELGGVEYAGDLEPIVLYALEGLIDAGMIDETAEVIRRRGCDGFAEVSGRYAALICKVERAEEAEKLLQVAFELMTGLEESDRTDVLKNFLSEIIACAFSQASQQARTKAMLAQALQSAREIRSIPVRSDALAKIALAVAQTGTFDRALQVAEGDSGKIENQSVVAAALYQAGQVNTSLTAVSAMSKSLHSIVSSFAQMGRFDQAIRVADAIAHASSKNESFFREIASALAQNGEFNRALQTADEITNSVVKSEVLALISVALADDGHHLRAQKVLSDVERIAVENPSTKDATLGAVVSSLIHAEAFVEAWQVIEEIESPVIKTEMLSSIAFAPAHNGNSSQAKMGLTLVLQDAADIASELEKIVSVADLAQAGKFDQAIEAANNIKDKRVRDKCCGYIASTLLNKYG